jgi:hypothetical protein
MFNSNDESQTESTTYSNSSDSYNQNSVNDDEKKRNRSLSFERRKKSISPTRLSHKNSSFSSSRIGQGEYREDRNGHPFHHESSSSFHETQRRWEIASRTRRSSSRSDREHMPFSSHRSRSPLAYGQVFNQHHHPHNHHHHQASSHRFNQARYERHPYLRPTRTRDKSSARRRSRSPYVRSKFPLVRKDPSAYFRDEGRENRRDGGRIRAPPNNILGIFGLDKQVDEQDLLEMYQDYGCTNCKIIIDKHVITKTDFAFMIHFLII